jgi:hypothetical protein
MSGNASGRKKFLPKTPPGPLLPRVGGGGASESATPGKRRPKPLPGSLSPAADGPPEWRTASLPLRLSGSQKTSTQSRTRQSLTKPGGPNQSHASSQLPSFPGRRTPGLGACRPPLRHSSSQARETSTQGRRRQSLPKPGGAQFSGSADANLADAGPEGFASCLPEGFAGPRRGGAGRSARPRGPALPSPPEEGRGGFSFLFFRPPGFKLPGKSPGPRSLRGSKARRFQRLESSLHCDCEVRRLLGRWRKAGRFPPPG